MRYGDDEMKEVFSKLFEKLINEKKGFKIITWIFIVLLILTIVLYPIIDANFLYYNRTNKRIEIIQKIISIDENSVKKDKRIEDEYNSILEDMDNQSNNYINNIFQKETNKGRNIAKFLAGSWLFIIAGIIIPFTKDKNKGKRFTLNNIFSGILCFAIAGLLGFICIKIPNIINFGVNIVLYLIILIFFTYTIATIEKKPQ